MLFGFRLYYKAIIIIIIIIIKYGTGIKIDTQINGTGQRDQKLTYTV